MELFRRAPVPDDASRRRQEQEVYSVVEGLDRVRRETRTNRRRANAIIATIEQSRRTIGHPLRDGDGSHIHS
jgi:hypothetical protein